MSKRSWLFNHLPLLDFYLKIPFLTIQTSIMRAWYVHMEFEYIVCRLQLFKWEWRVRLYTTAKREIINNAPKSDD